VAVALAARGRRARLEPSPDLVLMFGRLTDPELIASLVGPGDWLLYQFTPLREHARPIERWCSAAVTAVSARAEHRRRARGGRFVMVVPHASWCDARKTERFAIESVVAPIAGARALEPGSDARKRLGLKSGERIALFFGAVSNKDVSTVLAAFAALPDWTLLLGGLVASTVLADDENERTIRFEGNVSNTTRELLFLASDLVVLSFNRGYVKSSGTLMDAISAATPVVCSDGSAAADIVARFGIGELFTAGDANALVDAVGRVDPRTRDYDFGPVQAAYSNVGIARRLSEIAAGTDSRCKNR
jgi:glycosyltransferase involved in cell wall biosynthesis